MAFVCGWGNLGSDSSIWLLLVVVFEVSVQDLTDSESAEFAWEDVALGGFDLVRAT